jgi:hypothetical protein
VALFNLAMLQQVSAASHPLCIHTGTQPPSHYYHPSTCFLPRAVLCYAWCRTNGGTAKLKGCTSDLWKSSRATPEHGQTWARSTMPLVRRSTVPSSAPLVAPPLTANTLDLIPGFRINH